MTVRGTWAGSVLGGITDTAYTAMSTAVAAAQAKADAAMTKANTAATAATSAATTASGAAATAGSTAASLEQLNTAIVNADKAHAGFQTAIDALQSRVQTIALGYTQLGALLALNASTDVAVTLTRSMGRTDYNVELSSVTGATVTVKTGTKTATGFTATIKAASVALAIGTPVIAIAWI